MSRGNTIRCAYNECMLPDNNSKFLIQLFYLVISICFLFKSSSDFTFFAILMYTAPILLDLIYAGMHGIVFRVIKGVFITFNAVIIAFCFLGLFGVVVDLGDKFQVIETALLLSAYSIEKKKLVYPLLFELLVPISMFIGSPNRNAKKAVEFVLKEGTQ